MRSAQARTRRLGKGNLKTTCIIIEDEPLARERAREYCGRVPFLQLVGEFDNALDGLAFLKTAQVDLIFLDINLGGLSGIGLLETTAIKSRVIITTAYKEYALKGFDLKVADYLLKPYTFERFLQAVDTAVGEIGKPETAPEFIFVKTESRLEKIVLADVLFIEGMRDYRRIHCTEKRIMTLETFGELEKRIPANIVCRVHRSFMVSIAKIESIERDRIKIGKQLIPISESYKEGFYSLIK